MNTPRRHHVIQQVTQTVCAFGLALLTTLATLGSLNHLAAEQHAAVQMAKAAAAAQQAQASARPAPARS